MLLTGNSHTSCIYHEPYRTPFFFRRDYFHNLYMGTIENRTRLEVEKIRCILEFILRDLKHLKIDKSVFTEFESDNDIDHDISAISEIIFTDIADYPATKIFFSTQQVLKTKFARFRMKYVEKLLPFNNAYRAKIELAVRQIERKSDDLHNRGFIAAANVAAALASNLTEMTADLFGQGDVSPALLAKFKRDVKLKIDAVAPTLKKHREFWKVVVGNLLLAVLGVGVIYAVASCINKASGSKSFLFFNYTASGKILEDVSSVIKMDCRGHCVASQ